jgi:FKBP-type peptidyl-prolyl cis-trans isomerase (trigger factor)
MKTLYVFSILAAILLVSGCLGDGAEETTPEVPDNDGGENMVVKSGDTVKVDYWLTVDGEQIDTSEGRGPFEFTVESGQVIPGFDKAVLGMEVGETKETVLEGDDAYTAGPLAGKVLNFKITILEIN